jgi:hypothetical protein
MQEIAGFFGPSDAGGEQATARLRGPAAGIRIALARGPKKLAIIELFQGSRSGGRREWSGPVSRGTGGIEWPRMALFLDIRGVHWSDPLIPQTQGASCIASLRCDGRLWEPSGEVGRVRRAARGCGGAQPDRARSEPDPDRPVPSDGHFRLVPAMPRDAPYGRVPRCAAGIQGSREVVTKTSKTGGGPRERLRAPAGRGAPGRADSAAEGRAGGGPVFARTVVAVSYRVVVARSAERELQALPADAHRRVGTALLRLEADPRPHVVVISP